jgi:hypothetical protein
MVSPQETHVYSARYTVDAPATTLRDNKQEYEFSVVDVQQVNNQTAQIKHKDPAEKKTRILCSLYLSCKHPTKLRITTQ